jgi:hypothetical protein
MLSPKDYLIVEWANIARTLKETLRYRYAETATEAFYAECHERLKFIKRLMDAVSEDDKPGLDDLLARLDRLSDLVTSIEHSHLEEFSWPFAYALEKISKAICSDTSPQASEAIFFFRAEGGMSSYAVLPEGNGPGIFKRKIFPVIFPRTLKDAVLLHTIIGHEIGHAAISTGRQILFDSRNTMIESSIVENNSALFDWCKAHIGVSERVDEDYLSETRASWAEEFFCDLFGLVAMGPPFLLAFRSLLEVTSFDANCIYVPSHPPYASRAIALMHAARALGMLYSENAPPDDLAQITGQLDREFVSHVAECTSTGFEILDASRVAAATRALATFMQSFDGLAFPTPDPALLAQLTASLQASVPPVGPFPSATILGGRASYVDPQAIDFRHILLSGWLYWATVAAEKPYCRVSSGQQSVLARDYAATRHCLCVRKQRECLG